MSVCPVSFNTHNHTNDDTVILVCKIIDFNEVCLFVLWFNVTDNNFQACYKGANSCWGLTRIIGSRCVFSVTLSGATWVRFTVRLTMPPRISRLN